MAEPAVAVDPSDPDRIAAAADPYLGPVRIQVVVSEDGGQTWNTPIDLLPEGFAKSYDPSLAFTDDGRLIVVGGASGSGRPNCQTGSAIFSATIVAGTVSYGLVRDARPDGAYADRPRFALVDDESIVTWTESTGPDAECRGVPIASSVMFSRSTNDGGFAPARPLPSSGFVAPFGTSRPIAVGDRLLIAVGEHDGAGRSRAVVVTSDDGGATFLPPRVAWEGATTPRHISGVGGLVAPLPSLATDGSRVAVAWSTARDAGAQLIVAESSDGQTWTDISPPPAPPGATETFAEAGYDQAGGLWIASARFSNATTSFVVRRRATQQWTEPTELATGASGSFLEFGQTLGLALNPTALFVAAPVDSATEATLEVVKLELPPEALPAPDVPEQDDGDAGTTAGSSVPNAPATPPGSGGPGLEIPAGPGIALLAGVVGVAFMVSRRSRTRSSWPP